MLILASDPQRWNKVTVPISTTSRSVTEAGWQPVTPGFLREPEADTLLDEVLLNNAQIAKRISKDPQ